MCIVFWTRAQPGYKLILAANRDEHLDRPASPAAWHTFEQLARAGAAYAVPDAARAEPRVQAGADALAPAEKAPWVLSGRDLGSAEGGTWLGMTRDLRVGIITNIRLTPPLEPPLPDPPSRGRLLREFLSPAPGAAPSLLAYLASHLPTAAHYAGFNLLLFDAGAPGKAETDAAPPGQGAVRTGYLSNRPGAAAQDLTQGAPSGAGYSGGRGHGDADADADGADDPRPGPACHGLSNSPLDRPWAKVTAGEAAMRAHLVAWSAGAGAGARADEADLVERMMDVLSPSVPLRSLADTTRCTLLKPLQIGADPDVDPSAPPKLRLELHVKRAVADLETPLPSGPSSPAPLDPQSAFIASEPASAVGPGMNENKHSDSSTASSADADEMAPPAAHTGSPASAAGLLPAPAPASAAPAPRRGLRWYGTRVSTVILVRDDGHVVFVERDRARLVDGAPVEGGGERRFEFDACAE
ncbi:hypothetical protein Q5752_001173 [Cryptotrichosporon argae]